MKLYHHWTSSCSRRVRIALSLKRLEYENVIVQSVKDPDFLKLNPMGYVPVLVDDNLVVSDSFAILLYLEEKYHEYPLLPLDLQKKALNYQIASIVSSSIQPLQNLTLVNYIGELVNPDEKLPWAQHHIRKGFVAIEKLLGKYAGKYATGDEVFLADLFLAPQLYNAFNMFRVDMTEFPILSRLYEAYKDIPAFQVVFEKQPDDAIQQ